MPYGPDGVYVYTESDLAAPQGAFSALLNRGIRSVADRQNVGGGAAVTKVYLTRAAYDALPEKDPAVEYNIVRNAARSNATKIFYLDYGSYLSLPQKDPDAEYNIRSRSI